MNLKVNETVADPTGMRDALSSVLTDPVFVRSPALTRLLRYLVEVSIGGHGASLKSYSVAVDGLGKNPDFDSQADSYARVLVARLRKALDAHYAGSDPAQGMRLSIDSGSYEVRLIPTGRAERAQPIARGSRISWRTRRIAAIALTVCLVAATAMFLQWRADSEAARQRWRTANFPFVDVSVVDETGGELGSVFARQMRQSITMNLDNYEGVRIAYNPSARAEYSINVILRKSGADSMEYVEVIDRKTNRLLWSDNEKMTFDVDDNELSSDAFLHNAIFHITHPSGIIPAFERRRNFAADTPYGCWLQFSAMLQDNATIGNTALIDCARDWYAAAPNHPVAAALYGWTLTDNSISRFTESRHREALQEAVGVLERARAMNPNSPLLQVAAMRAFAFSGDKASMHAAADQALKLNPDNIDIQGAVGAILAMQNDPRGETLLVKAVAEHFNPPAWYFVGLFVSAMMRDDTAGAGRSLAKLGAFHHSLPVQPMLSAAFQARTGHPDQARAEWDRAISMQPALRIMPDTVISRMPIAAEVRVRLEQWLAPVLGK